MGDVANWRTKSRSQLWMNPHCLTNRQLFNSKWCAFQMQLSTNISRHYLPSSLISTRPWPNWPWVKIQTVRPVNIPIPTQIGSKWVVHLPQNGIPLLLTHSQLTAPRGASRGASAGLAGGWLAALVSC